MQHCKDPFDQAACHYRMVANPRGELFFFFIQINKNKSHFAQLHWHPCRLYLKMELSPRCLGGSANTPPFTIWASIWKSKNINVQLWNNQVTKQDRGNNWKESAIKKEVLKTQKFVFSSILIVTYSQLITITGLRLQIDYIFIGKYIQYMYIY